MYVKIYKCFIASPGDTQSERKICEKIFEEINTTIGKTNNFRIESLTWEKDSRPSFAGTYSQETISNQLGLDYDLFIGIMYNKFGTPTKAAESGTEEEFDLAYEKLQNGDDLDIMFYFNSEPISVENIDLDQLSKVKEFKNKLATYGGYYWKYNGKDEFETFLRKHINDFLLKKK